MIKVNLLRNTSDSTAKVTSTDLNFDTAFETKPRISVDMKELLTKLAVLGMATVALILYENYNISELRAQLSQARATSTALKAELAEKKPIADRARELQTQIQDIEARIKAIKDLSKVRLREIRAIDNLQNIIPEKLWFTGLEFEQNTLKIEGGTTSDDQLNRFLDDMESKSNFKNVILLRSVEQKNKEGTIKTFNITCSLASVD